MARKSKEIALAKEIFWKLYKIERMFIRNLPATDKIFCTDVHSIYEDLDNLMRLLEVESKREEDDEPVTLCDLCYRALIQKSEEGQELHD